MTEEEAKAKHIQTRNRINKKSTARYKDRKIDYVDSLKTPCIKCGEIRKYVIDFHHIDPSTKLFNINTAIKERSWSDLKNEIQKCICLCRNCHQEFHYLYSSLPMKEDLVEYTGYTEEYIEKLKKMTLPYYKIEKSEEGKRFFYSHLGYFNFWDEYLIVNTEKGKGKMFSVLVNRTGRKFSNTLVRKRYKECVRSTLADSVCFRKPEEMFKDFPELQDYNWLSKCSQHYKEGDNIEG